MTIPSTTTHTWPLLRHSSDANHDHHHTDSVDQAIDWENLHDYKISTPKALPLLRQKEPPQTAPPPHNFCAVLNATRRLVRLDTTMTPRPI